MEKPFEDFAWRRVAKGQLDNYCRPCRSAYKKEHYAKHKMRYVGQASSRRRRILDERMAYLFEYWKSHPCVDCGEDDPVVLDFDHREDKSFSISEGIRNRNWEAVLKEIAKCDVVCANCHRRRTAMRGGHVRWNWSSRLL